MVKKDKGKARAVDIDDTPTESSPLLGEDSGSPSRSHLHPRQVHPHIAAIQSERARESRTRSILYIALIVSLSLLAAFGLFLALLLNSFRPSVTELDSLQETAFQYAGPDSISIVNITDDGVLVNVSLRAGIDWDRALGIQQWANEEEKQQAVWKGDRGTGADWWETLRRWTADKMMGQLSEPAVRVDIPDQVLVLPDHFDTFPLLQVSIPGEFRVPMIKNARSSGQDWLPPLSIMALAKPIASTGDLLAFAQKAWEHGELKVVIGVPKARATIPLEGFLAQYAKIEKLDITKQISMPVPRLPGLPLPGKPLNLSSLVHLESYTLSTRGQELHIAALATLPNFAPELNTTLPFNLPFSIHLPDGQAMAEVITAPLHLGGPADKLNVHIEGAVVADFTPVPKSGIDGESDSESAISLFLQNYLSGKDNPILVRGLSNLPSFARPNLSPPHWLLSTLPSISLPLAFPGPSPKPKIIQTVTIESMRISESRGKMLASGTVIAEISLPKGMEAVDVTINAVKPDIMVYDGPVDDDEPDGDDEEYPAKAFGHINPEEWLKATSERYQNPEHPDWITVRAPMEDIPIEILKGRDGVMRGFVSKMIFKGGAVAGIKGTADVQVQLRGVRGQVGLGGLPVKGEVWVGRQRKLSIGGEPE